MRFSVVLLFVFFAGFSLEAKSGDGFGNPPDSSAVKSETNLKEYVKDTVSSIEEKNSRFYERLEKSAETSRFAKWIHGMLIVTPRDRDKEDQVIDETAIYARYNGKSIVSIEVENRPIFDRARSVLQKAMESVHARTWKYAIRRDLLFEAGDKLEADMVVRTKQLLKSRRYFYDADIIIEPFPEDTTAVIVKVITRDKWTIGLDGSVGGLSSGRISGDIFDYNFVGSGNALKYRLSLNWKGDDGGVYQGSLLQYNVPNMFSKFYDGDFILGRSFARTRYLGNINKKIYLPDDYEVGVRVGWEENQVRDLVTNEDAPFSVMEYDLWAGRSVEIESINSSVYGMLRFHDLNYHRRPEETGPDMHPWFHDKTLFLGSAGLYRENFLSTNLIYGYGIREYVATGYRIEINGGYTWEEFGEGWYAGLSARMGGFTSLGYMSGDVSVGSYMGYNGMDFYRSTLNAGFSYFTNLINLGPHNQLRQFFFANLTKGWNRTDGVGEHIRFTSSSGPRYFHEKITGRNRFVLGTESVVFTPWIPLGFRIALFGFADVGWLGDKTNIFRNDVYSTLGFGIRLKNERLIFSTIEISLNFAFGKNGWMRTEPVRLGGEKRMRMLRYIPEKPQIVEYK